MGTFWQRQMKCLFCGNELTGSSKKFCNNVCKNKKHWKDVCFEIEKNGCFPNRGKWRETERRIARRYIDEKIGHKCAICGISEWNNKKLNLVVDHIDGDSSNSLIDNVRLICPNCDSQLQTFKNKMGKTKNRKIKDEYSRAQRKAEEYDNKLNKIGYKRCKRIRARGICGICGKEFEKNRISQKYCSKQCNFEANRRNPTGCYNHKK